MLRDFSYLLISSKKLEEFSFTSRLVTGLTFTFLAIVAFRYAQEGWIIRITRLLAIFSAQLLIISYLRGLRALLMGLRLLLFFILVGTAILYIGPLFGWSSPHPLDALTGVIGLVVIFITLSLFFQLVSIREWRRVFEILHLKRHALLFSLVLLQMPLTLYYLSEAFTTIKLKYGGKRLHKVVIPMVLLLLYTSRSYLEAYMLYGLPERCKLEKFKSRDVLLYLTLIATAILFLTI